MNISVTSTDDFLTKMAMSQPGDTLIIDGTVRNFTSEFTWAPGRAYNAINGATFRGSSPNGPMSNIRGDNITITGFVFEGGGIFIDRTGQPAGAGKNRNIVIDNNTFRMTTGNGSFRHGISLTVGLRDSSITNNLFAGYNGGFGIYGYNYRNLTIANNEFVDVVAACHIDALDGDCGNLTVKENYVRGVKGMGFEFQSDADGVTFVDNVVELPNLVAGASRHPANDNSMAFSLILARAKNITIKRNKVFAPDRPDQYGMRVGFELGGDNCVCEDNYIEGPYIAAADNDGEGGGSVLFQNNRVINCPGGDYQAFPAPGRTYRATNNGPNVTLTWDPKRSNPGIDKHPGGPPVPPVPTPEPTPVPTFTPTLTVTGETTCTLSWPLQDGTNDYTIESKTTRGSDPWTRVGVTNSNFARIAGCHPGWEISFRVIGPTTSAIVSDRMKGNPVTVAMNLPTMLLDIPVPDPVPVPVPPNPPPLKRLVRTLTLREFDDGSFDVVKV
jgi:hypothetical protein